MKIEELKKKLLEAVEKELQEDGSLYDALQKFIEQNPVDPFDIEDDDDDTTIGDDVDSVTRRILKQLGFPSHILGYHYIIVAIPYVMGKSTVSLSVTRDLYPTIAKRFDTTPTRVERAIRHSIILSWPRADQALVKEIFGNSVADATPTNSEFIFAVAEYVRNNSHN